MIKTYCIELSLGKKSIKNYLPMQDGNVISTFSDSPALSYSVGFSSNTDLRDGLFSTVDWYLAYYRLSGSV